MAHFVPCKRFRESNYRFLGAQPPIKKRKTKINTRDPRESKHGPKKRRESKSLSSYNRSETKEM